jgi:RND family efflux transporter MFP subunit
MRLSWRWGIALVAVLAGAGLIARSVVSRQHEQARLTQSAASTQGGALTLREADLAIARQGTMWRTIPVSGSIEAVHAVVLKSRVNGEIKALSVREGDVVHRGQLIASIDAEEYRNRLEQARQQAASAKAQWQIARRTLETNQGLVAQGFISRNALDTSASNAAAAQANAQAAKAAVRIASQALDEATVTSPIGGTVSQRFAQAGERVAPESKLVEIVNLSALEVEVNLRPQDVAQVRVGTSGRLQVEGVADPISAKVARINPSADPATRAVKVYLSVKGHPALRQGLYAQGQLTLDQQQTLVIPRATLRHDAAGDYVQVVRLGKVAHQRVTTGGEGSLPDDATAPVVAITSGLVAGERVLKESLGVLAEGTLVDLPAQPTAAGR